MNVLPLIIRLVSGAAGGNLVACGCDKISLGSTLSSLTGMLGGDIGAKVLQCLTGTEVFGTTSDVQIFLVNVLGGAVGGAVLTAFMGWIKTMFGRRS